MNIKNYITCLLTVGIVFLSEAQPTSFYNANQYLQRFTGDFGGNWYCCGSTDAWVLTGANTRSPFINMSDEGMNNIFGNGTTTGVSDAWAFYITGGTGLGSSNLYGTSTNALDLTFNAPAPSSYSGPVVTGTLTDYDSRRSVFFKLLNDPTSNSGFWSDAPDVINPTNPNFSLVVTNHSSNNGFVRVEFLTTGAVWGGVASSREFSLPANTTSVLTAGDLSGNVGAVALRLSGIVGRVVFDDLAIGLAAPTVTALNMTIGGVVSTTSALANSTSGTLSLNVSGHELYQDLRYFNFNVSGAAGMMTVDGLGNISTASSGYGVVTVTAISKFDNTMRFAREYTVGTAPASISVSGVNISGASSLTVTGTPTPSTYTVTVSPSNASNTDVAWSLAGTGAIISSTTTSTLNLTPNAGGVVTITATSISDPSVSGTFVVTITPLISTIPVTGITVSGVGILTVGGTATYSASIEPINATDLDITWDVLPLGLASISGTGELSALAAGIVTITATSVSTPAVSGVLLLEIVTVNGGSIDGPTPTVPGTTTGLAVQRKVSFSIAPNPAIEVANVIGVSGDFSVQVLNSLGSEVWTGNTALIPVAALPKGVYIVVIRTASGVGTTRLLKE